MDRNYDGITLILKYLYFKKARVAIFADIIKIVTIFIKTIFKNSKKWKELLDIAKFAYFDVSRTQRVCHVIHNFLDLFWVRYNFAKFVIIGCFKDFRAGAFWPPPPPSVSSPIWIRLIRLILLKKTQTRMYFLSFSEI